METNKYYIEILSDYYSNIQNTEIPEKIFHKTRLTLYDFLTVLIVGKKYGVLSPIIESYIKKNKSAEESTCLGLSLKTSAELAALAMGVISHSVELDDGHRYGTAHPSVAIIPASLAVGEKMNVKIADLLRSIIIGYDCMLRLARSINPSHLKRGFHSTGTCGALGAAAAAAVIYSFDEKKMAFAISMGGLQSAGLQEMLHGYPSIKALQPGKSAQAGVISAELVNLGARSPLSILEGIHGWLKAMTDCFDENSLIGDLGKRWEIEYTYTKLYPTCRHCHQSIDIGIKLHKSGFSISDIKQLNLYMYDVGINEVGIIRNPENFEQAMFSVAYSLAIGLKYGFVRIQELQSCLDDKEILAFANKINIISDEEMNRNYPHERGARIEILTFDNRQIIETIKLPRGEYDTPLTDNEYLEKSKIILDGIVSMNFIEELWNLCIIEDSNIIKINDIIKMFNKI